MSKLSIVNNKKKQKRTVTISPTDCSIGVKMESYLVERFSIRV